MRGELWFSLEEFERSLENGGILGFKVQVKKIHDHYEARIKEMRQQAEFYIEAQGRAMLEVKLRY